ncbi:hypothetical protein IVA95_16225 [Bradyrhizobium sp. 157]|uniref:hypothetical protein n=1 Tax=Bradyrhizobium sp. 157 TaxID=2782631 RepID=UPI001FFC0356|nr:hypothetical protein [Bradyrhizobium sp. 157]MCK1639108.1 hypothetical protein [Bradyrhizobium sp. 157]
MRYTEREAVQTYQLARALISEHGDTLAIDPLLTIKLRGNVLTIVWRPYGLDEVVMVAIDGTPPEIVTFKPSRAWKRILQRA